MSAGFSIISKIFFIVFYQKSNNCDVQNQWQQEQKSALFDDDAASFGEYQ